LAALIAAVTDLTGAITGAHRTWLDPSGHDKARRYGQGVRWVISSATQLVPVSSGRHGGRRGIENMLSLRSVMPTMPMVAALSAITLPPSLFPASCAAFMSPANAILRATPDGDPNRTGAAAGIARLASRPPPWRLQRRSRRRGIDDLSRSLRVQLVRQTWYDSWHQRWRPERMDEATSLFRVLDRAGSVGTRYRRKPPHGLGEGDRTEADRVRNAFRGYFPPRVDLG